MSKPKKLLTIRFLKNVADGALGTFMEGRIISIDPTAAEYPTFENLLNAGVAVVVKDAVERAIPPGASEAAVAPTQQTATASPGAGRGPRSRALGAGKA